MASITKCRVCRKKNVPLFAAEEEGFSCDTFRCKACLLATIRTLMPSATDEWSKCWSVVAIDSADDFTPSFSTDRVIIVNRKQRSQTPSPFLRGGTMTHIRFSVGCESICYLSNYFLDGCVQLEYIDFGCLRNVHTTDVGFLMNCTNIRFMNLEPLGNSLTETKGAFLSGTYDHLRELDLSQMQRLEPLMCGFWCGGQFPSLQRVQLPRLVNRSRTTNDWRTQRVVQDYRPVLGESAFEGLSTATEEEKVYAIATPSLDLTCWAGAAGVEIESLRTLLTEKHEFHDAEGFVRGWSTGNIDRQSCIIHFSRDVRVEDEDEDAGWQGATSTRIAQVRLNTIWQGLLAETCNRTVGLTLSAGGTPL